MNQINFRSMSRASLLLAITFALAIVNSFFLTVHLLFLFGNTGLVSSQGSGFQAGLLSLISSTDPVYQFILSNSLTLSVSSWLLVGGVWTWRGKMRTRWETLGFDSDIFDLFLKMKGAKTRMSLLDSLSRPKDRMQLAQELGLDWKAVNYHVILLCRYGLINESDAFGKVKIYRLTKQGEILLQLLREFNGLTQDAPNLPASNSASVQNQVRP